MKIDTTEATVLLDVGHGNCAVVRSQGQVAVIDAGSGSVLETHLMDESIRQVNLLFLSHADQDHVEGALGALVSDRFRIEDVYVNADALKTSALWQDLLWQLDKAQLEGRTRVHIGLTPSSGPFSLGDVRLHVLGPSPYLCGTGVGGSHRDNGRRITSNTISAVIAVEHEGIRRVLLTGDVDDTGIHDLQRCGVALETDVLVFPHHGGSSGGTSPRTLGSSLRELTQARTTVFSTGRRSRWTNPDPEVISGIFDVSTEHHVVCTQMSRHCSDGTSKDSRHLLPIISRGRVKDECCAGSIVIPHKGGFQPYKGHRRFVQRSAKTALCIGPRT